LVALDDGAVLDARFDKVGRPPGEAGCAAHTQPRTGDGVAAALLPWRIRPVKEGDVAAGRGHAVAIEEVIGADVVLVDRLLDQAHAQRLSIEGEIRASAYGDGGQMMTAGKHRMHSRFSLPEPAGFSAAGAGCLSPAR